MRLVIVVMALGLLLGCAPKKPDSCDDGQARKVARCQAV